MQIKLLMLIIPIHNKINIFITQILIFLCIRFIQMQSQLHQVINNNIVILI